MMDSSDVLVEMLTLNVTVDEFGTRIYRNSSSERHRQHGPAVEWADGSKSWWLNGRLHRVDGPAIECASGAKFWWLNGEEVTYEEHAHRVNPAQEMTVADIEAALGKRVKIIK